MDSESYLPDMSLVFSARGLHVGSRAEGEE